MLKLPFGKATLTSKKGRLTKGTLSIHKRKWASSIAAYMDEISMVSADQFLHMDVRMRQAKNMKTVPFGGLAMNLCGDFLQLPPVDKYGTRKSLAKPVDDAGFLEPESADEDTAGDGKRIKDVQSKKPLPKDVRASCLGATCVAWCVCR